jgi:hypothetical protein
MALNGIRSQDQAMWVHHATQLRRVQLMKQHEVSRWGRVPLHVRLEMRAQVLAESETEFATDSTTPGRYTVLTSKLSRTKASKAAPQPEPVAGLSTQATPRELEPQDDQPALPIGAAAVSEPAPAAERPYVIEDEAVAGITFETGAEREAREAQEAEEQNQRRQANYDKAVEVALELAQLGQPVTGAGIASDERVPVGQRSAERYLKRMRHEGLLPD